MLLSAPASPGPARIAYRLRHDPAKAHLADIETIERVQEKMSELWHQTAQEPPLGRQLCL